MTRVRSKGVTSFCLHRQKPVILTNLFPRAYLSLGIAVTFGRLRKSRKCENNRHIEKCVHEIKFMANQPVVNNIPKLALTREEAAQAIGCHAITNSRLTERGLLRPSRATRRPLYRVTEIKRFLRDTASKPVEAGHRLTVAKSKQLCD
jgi:hypothetical protein